MKPGNKVKTIYGTIETILAVIGCQVITVESHRRLIWYHRTKVWDVKKEKRL